MKNILKLMILKYPIFQNFWIVKYKCFVSNCLLLDSNKHMQNFNSFDQAIFELYLRKLNSTGESIGHFKMNSTLEAQKFGYM